MKQLNLNDMRKLGFRILASNFSDLLKNPYKLTFAITYKCNSKCKTCFIWKKKQKDEFNLDEIEKFSKKSPFFSWINLTGGEPFLNEDIVEIARIFSENSKCLSLFNTTTNGYATDRIHEKVQEMLKLDISKIIVPVSLDGPRETHDSIRGVEDSWEKALETYKLLKELEKENDNFKTFLGYTLSSFNVGKFLETYSSVREIIPNIKPNDFHINLFHTSQHYFSNETDKIKNYDQERFLSELITIKKIKERKAFSFEPINLLERNYLKFAKEFVENNRKTPLSCKAVLTSVFIDPKGNVFPCIIFNELLGNLRDFNYDLKSILTLKKTKTIKRNIEKLNCPNCWAPCEAYQTILGNLFNLRII